MSEPARLGRPATEWSTPPTAEGKPSTAAQRLATRRERSSRAPESAVARTKGIPRSALSGAHHPLPPPLPSSHAQELTAAIQGLQLSNSHDVSWAPLTAIATPSLATMKQLYPPSQMSSATNPVVSSSSSAVFQRHSNVETVGGGNKVSLEGDLIERSTSAAMEPLQPLPPAAQLSSLKHTSNHTHPPQAAITSHSDHRPPLATQWGAPPHPPRSLSDKQLYTPLPESIHDSNAPPINYASRAKTLPSYTCKASTPTARVHPLVDGLSKRGDAKSTALRNSQSMSSLHDVKSSGDAMGPSIVSELERVKLLTLSSPVVVDGGMGSCDHHMMPSDFLGSAEKWKALIETKDRIMVQKNLLIERQKQTIARLQAQVREGEGRLSARAQDEGGTTLTAHLKELEYENSLLRSELAEARRTGGTETHSLNKKLDAAVYELDRLQAQFSDSQQQADAATRQLTLQLGQRAERVRELEESLARAQGKQEELAQHISKLSSYLGDMPTMEEHQTLLQQVVELRARLEEQSRAVEDGQGQLVDTLAALSSKEEQCSALEQRLEELQQRLATSECDAQAGQERVAALEPETSRLADECSRLQRLLCEAEEGGHSELQAMRERHKHKFLEATAALRSQHKTLAKRVKLLETQLLKNSDAMTALNSELQLSQGTIADLKYSIRQLVQQNQELVAQNLTLQETCAEAGKVAASISEVRTAIMKQLTAELTRCVEDFDSLVALSSSILEGRDPGASLVLGVKGQHSREVKGQEEGEGQWEERLEQVRRLQGEVERLREVITDQFATQVATACNVQ